ncbi:hypothetical protein [Acinetobacter sp. YH12086]|uniref:hypothetical protein n=1 Tax=Acinetobacter sp. YH12086 TaxID=2601078 RepID=UPI0015D32BD1|nr:hypothetical protein [Acinetobacter sp. YH12086]
MSELRERFERHQAGLLNIDYEELRDQFDHHEEIFGKRYVTFSDFEKEFELWQACWNHQQTIIDNLKAQLNNMEACYIEKKKRVELLESNIKNLVVQLSNNYEVAEDEYKKNADSYYSGKCDAFDLAEQLACLALRGDRDQHLTR